MLKKGLLHWKQKIKNIERGEVLGWSHYREKICHCSNYDILA